MRTRALYLCYFGLREPLVQTQVLPYLRELVRGGCAMTLLTFEPEAPGPWMTEWKERLRGEGIAWRSLRYHKRPSLPATLYDIVAGAIVAARLVRRERIDILHGRSHVGAAMGALAKKLTGARLIFDIRGLLAEEYVESGNWRAGSVRFRLTKRAEAALLRTADGFVVLTERAKRALFPDGAGGRPVEVIPTCVSAERFAPREDRDATRAELGATGRTVFVYAGTLGGYCLPDAMAGLLAVARERDPRSFALVLTQSPAEGLNGELGRHGFGPADRCVMQVSAADVPRYLRASDIALSIVRVSHAQIATSPTKFAEYLASGLPAIVTSGVGDLDAQVEEGRVGVLLRTLDRDGYRRALEAIERLRQDPQLGDRCRAMAKERYGLETVGGPRYRRLYAKLKRMRVLALASYPIESASTRYRIAQFIAPLAEEGIDVELSPFLDAPSFHDLYSPRRMLRRLPRVAWRVLRQCAAALRRADVVFVQREAMLFGPPLVEWLATRMRRRPMVLDLDDPTYIAMPSPVYGRLAMLLKWSRKTESLIRRAAAVTCGNPVVAAHAGEKAVVIPSVVDTAAFHPRTATNAVPVIGWIGTHSTYPFVERLRPVFDVLAREHAFRLVIIGSGRADVDTRAWSIETEAEDFRSFDIGVYPIADDAWSAGKSGLKAVQYMASGVPFVMSPVGVCGTMGIAGETHFPARSEDEWTDALRRLLSDPALRARMGRAGRAFAERHYALEAAASRLAEVIRAAAG